jgi:putative colanic acid biosynthesis UDP-glucose lipid carrier transferase
VNGLRGETRELWRMEERVKYDIWYFEHWSIGLDLRIMWLTVKDMLFSAKKALFK